MREKERAETEDERKHKATEAEEKSKGERM